MSRTIPVRTSRELHAAINAARGGDVIALEGGAQFEGPFRLPARTDEGWVIIRAAVDVDLPDRGRRLAPQSATRLPLSLIHI